MGPITDRHNSPQRSSTRPETSRALDDDMEAPSSASRQPILTPEQLSQAIQAGVVTLLRQLRKSPPKHIPHHADGVQNQHSHRSGRASQDRVRNLNGIHHNSTGATLSKNRHKVTIVMTRDGHRAEHLSRRMRCEITLPLHLQDPRRFPLPKIDYYGSGDLEDHIAKFANIIHLIIAINVVWCKYFPITLSRHVNTKIIFIPKLKQDVVLPLMNGLVRDPFRDSHAKKMSNILSEALSKADQFILIEEFNKVVEQITEGKIPPGRITPHLVKDKGKKKFIEANLGKPEKK
ncbi:hypothetical protein Cgig2_032667 [Carnegiea gigantea]|uniref:Uncharacterized protein n=1 Tax=Carnegiea gigantea TaxID=171969 RepID=A0A9Q1GQ57_9CARY|nr:hypothetical protein Cgig2_032667 [Carnegiea gigantea]